MIRSWTRLLYKDLPMAVKYRVQALRRLQLEEVQARAELEQAQLQLIQQYHKKLETSQNVRTRIVNGTYRGGAILTVHDDQKLRVSIGWAGP